MIPHWACWGPTRTCYTHTPKLSNTFLPFFPHQKLANFHVTGGSCRDRSEHVNHTKYLIELLTMRVFPGRKFLASPADDITGSMRWRMVEFFMSNFYALTLRLTWKAAIAPSMLDISCFQFVFWVRRDPYLLKYCEICVILVGFFLYFVNSRVDFFFSHKKTSFSSWGRRDSVENTQRTDDSEIRKIDCYACWKNWGKFSRKKRERRERTERKWEENCIFRLSFSHCSVWYGFYCGLVWCAIFLPWIHDWRLQRDEEWKVC